MIIADVQLRPYALRFRHPVETARGRFTHRRGWWVGLVDEEGWTGWGDAAAWPGFGAGDEAIAASLGQLAAEGLIGRRIATTTDLGYWSDPIWPPEVRYALELAMLSLLSQRTERPLAELLSLPGDGAALTSIACHRLALGEPLPLGAVVKVKVGARPIAVDVARVRSIRQRVGPDGRIRLDANGAWTLAEARRAIDALEPYQVDWIEEPVEARDWPAMGALRRELGVRIAADESVTGARDLQSAVAASAIDVLILKPMFAGGLLPARDLAQEAVAAGLDVVVTHALESAVGQAGAIALAAVLPEQVHGLAPPDFDEGLEDDIQPMRAPVIRIAVPARPPTGPAPDRQWHVQPGQSGSGAEGRAGREARSRLEDRAGPKAEQGAKRRAGHSARHSTPHDLPHPLRSFALARPDHEALRVLPSGDQRWTAAELADLVSRRAQWLLEAGVCPGDSVALSPPSDATSAAWIETFWALTWLGAAVAPLSPRAHSEADRHAEQALAPTKRLDAGAVGIAERPLAERFWPPEEVRLVLLTSGSTGQPKPVELTGLQLLLSAFGSAIRLGHSCDDRWLCCLPLNHIGGLSVLLRSVINNATALWLPTFEASEVARHLDDGQATLVSLVPSMLARVLDARPSRPFPPSLRAILVGGAPFPDSLRQQCKAIEAPVAMSWGMTEAASQIATRHCGDLSKGAAVGPPLAFARVTSGGDSRLIVHGPTVKDVLVTADRGTVRDDGAVEVWGRADRAILSGAELVDPVAIETALLAHPAVADAAVIGRPDARWGERPVALLVARLGRMRPDDDELRALCRTQVAAFAIPDTWRWVDVLPRGDLGKLRLEDLQSLVRVDQAMLGQSIAQAVRRPPSGPEAAQVDERVYELGNGAEPLVGAEDVEGKGYGAVGQSVHSERHAEMLTESDGPVVVGFGVNERHADGRLGHPAPEVAIDGRQKLLEGGVAVVVDAREEHDPGAVDFVESRGNRMNERHGGNRP